MPRRYPDDLTHRIGSMHKSAYDVCRIVKLHPDKHDSLRQRLHGATHSAGAFLSGTGLIDKQIFIFCVALNDVLGIKYVVDWEWHVESDMDAQVFLMTTGAKVVFKDGITLGSGVGMDVVTGKPCAVAPVDIVFAGLVPSCSCIVSWLLAIVHVAGVHLLVQQKHIKIAPCTYIGSRFP